MVDDVAAYPWSSYGLRADWLKEPNWLDMDPCFIELGQTAEEYAASRCAMVVTTDEVLE